MKRSNQRIFHSTNKYHAKRITADGDTFDSKKEYQRWCELKLLEKVHRIEKLQRQVKFPIIKKSKYGREIVYIADYVYYENGNMIVEDVKSEITRKNGVYRIKKRLVAELYSIEIREV